MSTNVLLSKIFGCDWLFGGGDAKVEDRPKRQDKPEKNVPCDYWLKDMTESGVYVPNRDITDKYSLNKQNGHGATSTVFICRNKETQKQFAAKRVDKKKMIAMYAHQQGSISERMVDEIKISMKLKHKHLIEIVDVFETTRHVWVVMELMAGGELFDFIINNQGKIKESDAMKIVFQLVTVMKHIHDCDIVHRDLKPENIMLTNRVNLDDPDHGDPFIKVIDFGMSKTLSPGTYAQSCLGTPGYIAPEVMHRKKYTNKVDMYAVGVITYIILCGYMPMKEPAPNGGKDTVVIFPYEEWSKISDDAKEFITKLVAYRPKKRMSAQEALEHSWLKPVAMKDKATLKKRNSILASADILAKPLTNKELRMRRSSALGEMSGEEKAEYEAMLKGMEEQRKREGQSSTSVGEDEKKEEESKN